MRRNLQRPVLATTAVIGAVLLAAAHSCGGAPVPVRPIPDQASDSPGGEGPARVRVAQRSPESRGSGEVDPPVAPPAAPDTSAGPEQRVAPERVRIHGRVVDDRRIGVANANVEIRAWSGAEPAVKWFTTSAVADQNGDFAQFIDEDRVTIGFGIETSADGFVEGWLSVKRDQYDALQGVDVPMERGRAIVGRVIDGDARPIPGTTVQLWYGSETTWPTAVDEDGRFATPRRAPCRAFELFVEAPGFTRRSIPIAAADETLHDVGEVVFRRGGRVAGVVEGTDGRPIEDVVLELQCVTTRDVSKPRCHTDSAGRFVFDDVGEDPVTIFVDGAQRGGPPAARRYFHGGASDVRPGRADVRIVARADATLTLRFVDAETRTPVDLKRAQYGLRDEGAPEPERLGGAVSSSNPLVSTMLSAECGRRYDLTVRASGFEDGRVNGIAVADVAAMTIDVPMRREK